MDDENITKRVDVIFSDYARDYQLKKKKKEEEELLRSQSGPSHQPASTQQTFQVHSISPVPSSLPYGRGRPITSVWNEYCRKTEQMKKASNGPGLIACMPISPETSSLNSADPKPLAERMSQNHRVPCTTTSLETSNLNSAAVLKPSGERMHQKEATVQQMKWPKVANSSPQSELPMHVIPAGMTQVSKPMHQAKQGFYTRTKFSGGQDRGVPKNINGTQSSRLSNFQQKTNTAPTTATSFQGITNTQHKASNSPSFSLQKALSAVKSPVEQENIQQPTERESPVEQSNVASSQKIERVDEYLKQLLELANEKKRSTFEENVPKMLKLSKVAEFIEEGRVLIRSTATHSPTLNFKDFPFDTRIHDALRSFGFDKPKTIQAYVWEAILRNHHVSYVTGSRGGKTLGYLIPILNNLLEPSDYSDVPTGCSPLVIVVCSSWENAEMVQQYCCHIMKKVPNFRACFFTDATNRSLQAALPSLINGMTVLAATAPALSFLLEGGREVISFDRCCHLVFDDADVLLKEHGEATRKLFQFYQESVRRTGVKSLIPRQIVACASHWTPGMEMLSSNAMINPSIFISSCMEAAVYGKMKLDVRFGTGKEMDGFLLQIVREKLKRRIIIFCRGYNEVSNVAEMVSAAIGVQPLLAHERSIITDLDFVTANWNAAQRGSAILICTDDVLERLNIKNAQTLIHYYIPHNSKYDFSYRLSFAMDNFLKEYSNDERPETHLLITKEFNNSLLTIVRFMRRFGHTVSDELEEEAILSFCGKEFRKKNLPICNKLKAFGFCRNMKLCGLRHMIHKNLDHPIVPRNGMVRIRITAICTATHYYARILKHLNEDNKLIDLSGSHFEICEQLRKHFRGNEQIQSIEGRKVEVGTLYARCFDGIYDRVRVESILETDHQKNPIEVAVFCVDQGCADKAMVTQLFELPDVLKNAPPEAIEIFLVGLKPLDRNTSWNEYSTRFVREKLMSKELDGRIVLALSSSLWLQPLHERKRLEGVNSFIVLTDIRKELLEAQLAERNDEHIVKLYHLCEAGGILLPNYSFGLAKKPNNKSVEVAHAFLPMNEEAKVEVVDIASPYEFFVVNTKFQKTLQVLEEDIKANLSKCKKLSYEDAQLETLCVAESPSEPGTWCRCYIKKKIVENDIWQFRVFFVDYGDFATVPLTKLKTLPIQFVSRLPFQAIACSLHGVGPKTGCGEWTEDAVAYFRSLTKDVEGYMQELNVQVKFKETVVDELTKGPHYRVSLINRQETEPRNIGEQMILQQYAIPLESEQEEVALQTSAALKKNMEAEEINETSRKVQRLVEDEDEMKFDISTDWFEYFFKSIGSNSDHRSSETTSASISTKHSKKTNLKPVTDSDQSSLALIDHTMPLKAKESRFPTTKWWQNEDTVTVSFFVENIDDSYTLEITENHFSFLADANGLRYELNTSTYGYVIPEKSSHSVSGSKVKLRLCKQEVGAFWSRLINSPFKQPWLNRDFDHWNPADFSDDDEPRLEPLVDEKYAFETRQSESSSSESDDECGDEKCFGEDD